jgi:hypothetical protein
MDTLENLNTEWQSKGYPFAQSTESGWTMTCPSCRMTVGDGKITLADALNRALVHHTKQCQNSPA